MGTGHTWECIYFIHSTFSWNHNLIFINSVYTVCITWCRLYSGNYCIGTVVDFLCQLCWYFKYFKIDTVCYSRFNIYQLLAKSLCKNAHCLKMHTGWFLKKKVTVLTLWGLLVVIFGVCEQELGEGPSTGLQAFIRALFSDLAIHHYHNLINIRQEIDAMSHQDPGLQKYRSQLQYVMFRLVMYSCQHLESSHPLRTYRLKERQVETKNQ